jgi:hypothetical protein
LRPSETPGRLFGDPVDRREDLAEMTGWTRLIIFVAIVTEAITAPRTSVLAHYLFPEPDGSVCPLKQHQLSTSRMDSLFETRDVLSQTTAILLLREDISNWSPNTQSAPWREAQNRGGVWSQSSCRSYLSRIQAQDLSLRFGINNCGALFCVRDDSG